MEVKNSSKLFTRKSDKLILKKKEISRLKLFENVYISIQDESIKLYIHEEKLSQPQATLVNYLS